MTQYLNLGGEERPVRFAMEALLQYEQRTGRNSLQDFSAMQSGTASVTLMLSLLFAGLCAGSSYTKQPVNYTLEDVAVWIGSDMTMLQKAAEMFAASFEPAQEGEPEKKIKPLKAIRGQA